MAADTQLAPFGGFTGVTVPEIRNQQSDSKMIPLVGHIITDDDIGALQVLYIISIKCTNAKFITRVVTIPCMS